MVWYFSGSADSGKGWPWRDSSAHRAHRHRGLATTEVARHRSGMGRLPASPWRSSIVASHPVSIIPRAHADINFTFVPVTNELLSLFLIFVSHASQIWVCGCLRCDLGVCAPLRYLYEEYINIYLLVFQSSAVLFNCNNTRRACLGPITFRFDIFSQLLFAWPFLILQLGATHAAAGNSILQPVFSLLRL